jgi:hypothetical protein
VGEHEGLQDNMSFSIPIEPDEKGMTGRECPQPDCLGYFKVKFGTGLIGEDLKCVCPYCGHRGDPNTFWTQEQLEYAKSIAVRQVTNLVIKELKKSEFTVRPKGPFGIGMSMKVTAGPPRPIRYYREKELETEVICSSCTLQYAIYGVFGFCPDCGIHNSLQILKKNLELAQKEIDISANVDSDELRQYLICDALENAVSSFDGFGREIVARNADRATAPEQASKISFQSLLSVDDKLERLFGFRLSSRIDLTKWKTALRAFQKRHLLAHKMGVIDEQYVSITGDATQIVGRRIQVSRDEVIAALQIVLELGESLASAI